MPYDRFLIAPIEVGLVVINASPIYDSTFTGRCIMVKEYKLRKDSIDETGNKYGMLTVVERFVGKRSNNPRGTHWRCLCECGRYCIVTGSHLREGRRKSCGCLRLRNIENTGINILMYTYRRRAWKHHHVFNLSKEVFYKLIKDKCFYCGSEPMQIIKRSKSKLDQIIYNGIDRLDPTKAYNPENCVTCCKYCNFAKSDSTVDEFRERIRRMYSWLMINS